MSHNKFEALGWSRLVHWCMLTPVQYLIHLGPPIFVKE